LLFSFIFIQKNNYLKLSIFNKSDKIYVSIYFKIFIALFILLALSIFLEAYTILFAILFVLYFIFYQIANFFRTEHINGVLDGILELKMDSINIKENNYLLEEINKIEIKYNDTLGDYISYQISFNPLFSNGTDNYIKLTLKTGDKITCYFQQTKNEKINFNKNQLINYYKKNKISWLALLDVLEITDYNKIQEFKNTL
jgi:hypothetical protein